MKTNPEIARDVLTEVIPLLRALSEWTEEAVHDLLMEHAAKTERKNGMVMWPVRIALSGKAVTPGGAVEIAVLLGREESLRRLDAALLKL